MKGKKAFSIIVLICIFFSLTGCGNATKPIKVNGRLTSITDSQINVDVFITKKNNGSSNSSSSQTSSEENVESESQSSPNAEDSTEGALMGESKIYNIDENTIFYRINGGKKVIVECPDVDLGAYVTVDVDGDDATEVFLHT